MPFVLQSVIQHLPYFLRQTSEVVSCLIWAISASYLEKERLVQLYQLVLSEGWSTTFCSPWSSHLSMDWHSMGNLAFVLEVRQSPCLLLRLVLGQSWANLSSCLFVTITEEKSELLCLGYCSFAGRKHRSVFSFCQSSLSWCHQDSHSLLSPILCDYLFLRHHYHLLLHRPYTR